MTKTLCSILASLLIAEAISSSPLNAQDLDPLTLVPANTGVIARLSAPADSLNDIETFVDTIQLGFGAVAKAQVSAGLGQAIYNPSFQGVDMTKDWYMGVIFESAKEQLAFLLIPATDADAMHQAVGDNLQFMESNGWVVLAKKEATIAAIRACVDGTTESASQVFDKTSLATLNSAHLAIGVNAKPLQTTFATELASGEDMLDQALEKMAEQIKQSSPSLDLEYVLSIYKDIGSTGLQAVRDTDSLVVGLRFTDTDFRADTIMQVGQETKTNMWLQTQPASEIARMKSLPQGLNTYYGLSGDPHGLINWSKKLMDGMLESDELKNRFNRVFDMLNDVKFGAMTGGVDIVDADQEAMRMFAVSEISPAAKIREGLALFGEAVEYNIGGITQKQSITLNAEQLDGQPVDIMKIQQTLPPELDPTGLQAAMNLQLYGPDGMVQRLMIKDDVMMQTMGGGAEAMQQLNASPSWSDENLLNARTRLHDSANVIFLADIPNMFHKMAKVVIGSGVLPLPLQPEMLDSLKIIPSYSGFSATVAPQQLQTRTSVPVETFMGFAQIAMFVQGAIGAGR